MSDREITLCVWSVTRTLSYCWNSHSTEQVNSENSTCMEKSKVKTTLSTTTLCRLYEIFSSGETLTNPKCSNKKQPRRSDDIIVVRASVQTSPITSQTRRSDELGIKRTTLRCIMHHDLHFFLFKIDLRQNCYLPISHVDWNGPKK